MVQVRILGAERPRRGNPAGDAWPQWGDRGFPYDATYRADSRAYGIDPGLPLRAGTFVSRPRVDVFGAMSDSAPDRWGQNLLRRAERRLARDKHRAERTLTASDFLVGVHDDRRQGALRYTAPDGAYLMAGVRVCRGR